MKIHILLMFSAVLALMLIQACTPLSKQAALVTPPQEDPLIGKIINTRDRSPVPFGPLVEKLARHDVIYLSEKHDNPMHHAIQHRIIAQLVENGHRPMVGFEFFSVSDTPLLLSFVDSGKANHGKETDAAVEKQMRKKLGWEDQSDEMWGFYYDLLVLAKDNGLWAAGLDLGTSQKRRITRKGFAGLTSLETERLFSTPAPGQAYADHMKSIFMAVHCGMGNEKMTERLYDTWLARNDRMALSVVELAAAGKKVDPPIGPVVVIAGNGHTEYGLGIMDRVGLLAPDLTQVNVGITEVFREEADLEAYLTPLDLDGYPDSLPADYLWFTPRVSNEDPCEKFKASLQRMKKAAP